LNQNNITGATTLFLGKEKEPVVIIDDFSNALPVLESASYSLVTKAPSELNVSQCIPHVDDVNPNILAIMHYLKGPEHNGTAFYRHRRTGFETITAARYEAYQAALKDDDESYGPPPQSYICRDTQRYELIGNIDAKPDRLIVYRGYMLHSGQITQDTNLSANPADGRLTVNMFLKGH